MNGLLIAGAVFAVLAALIHVYIFALESMRWTAESTRRVFGVKSLQDAELMKPLAFNQGFYNLFLAIGVVVGLVLIFASGVQQAGFGVTLFALLCMVLAAVVLLCSNPKLARAAAIQGLAPLIGAVLLIAAVAPFGG
jgi:putative membrane protein